MARRREMQRDWESRRRTRKCSTCEATPIGLVDLTKESCMGARPTETCVAPRHVDASRDALLSICSFRVLCCTRPLFCFICILFYFLRTSSVGVGGGRGAPRLSGFWFSFPCSADHERDWPPCKVVLSGWKPIRWM